MRVLAFDPGETTGWCYAHTFGDEKHAVTEWGEFPLWQRVEELINLYEPDVVVFESFRLYAWYARSLSWSQLETVQVIGVIRYLCEKMNVTWTSQTPSERKQVRDRPLTKGLSAHVISAFQHATLYLKRHK